MKKLKLLLVLPLMLLTACDDNHLYVSSNITDKWDRTWVQIISTGKTTISIPHHDYYFQFNEWKPYTKKVNQSDWNKFEVGDTYTFAISEKEKEYFFTESIVDVKDNTEEQ